MVELKWRNINSASSCKDIFGEAKGDERQYKNFCRIIKNNGFYKCATIPRNESINVSILLHGDIVFVPGEEEPVAKPHIAALDNLIAFKNNKTGEIILVAHPYLYDEDDLLAWCGDNELECCVYENVGFYKNCKNTVIIGDRPALEKATKKLNKENVKIKITKKQY